MSREQPAGLPHAREATIANAVERAIEKRASNLFALYAYGRAVEYQQIPTYDPPTVDALTIGRRQWDDRLTDAQRAPWLELARRHDDLFTGHRR